jgi:hypothetical protein
MPIPQDFPAYPADLATTGCLAETKAKLQLVSDSNLTTPPV